MRSDNRIVGENVTFSTNCKETGLNNNVLVYGTSGCGKTMSVAEPLLLQTFNTNLVVTVTKRRLVKKYTPLFKKRCYKVLDLNFTNPDESTVSFDPLEYVRTLSDMSFLAKSIVGITYGKNTNSTADPYWEQCAVSLLTAEIALCLAKSDGPRATLADVLELHDSITFSESCDGISTNKDDLFEKYKNTKRGAHAYNCWKTFKQAPFRTASCIFSTLNTILDTVFTQDIRKMMKLDKKLDFTKLGSEKTVLFVTTSAVNPALNSFINMFYAQLFKQLFEYAEKLPDGMLPIPVHVLCDDFATGGQILNFPEYISIFREKQISVTLLLQSESQLDAMYGYSNAITIINNCDTCLYMGGMDLKTGRSMSERLNLPLEDILYMPVGKMFVFRRGQKPIYTSRYDIEKNRLYQSITAQYNKTVEAEKEEERKKEEEKEHKRAEKTMKKAS
ncbi:MAG: type IV secretory system conjugative DNA transfer family protein [Ruminococcaceae bacterium]|nr:type IV secretory system conjugative DNA transfer family protein [Oscillospiraceae bacterium]